jgi:hypothetical protein
LDILKIARENVRKNPSIVGEETDVIVARYLAGIQDEIEEVRAEITPNNEVYLVDELSDIAWDYATLMAILEVRGLIPTVEEVLRHGYEKYSERAPAFLLKSNEMWDSVKAKQKEELQKRHQEKYGN